MASNAFPSDKPSIFDGLDASQKKAFAFPTPLPPGIAGLVFDWTGEEKLSLRSEITDSFVEDNTAIQDQIALLPETFSVNSTTAEVVFLGPKPSYSPPQAFNPLGLLASLVPSLTAGAANALAARALTAISVAALPAGVVNPGSSKTGNIAAALAASTLSQLSASLSSISLIPGTMGPALSGILGFGVGGIAGSALGSVPSSPATTASAATTSLYSYYQGLRSSGPTKQAAIVGFIYQLWKGRVLFTVSTPWGVFENMAIEIAESTQPAETNQQTDHQITFKKMNFAQELTVSLTAKAGRARAQAAAAAPGVNGNIGQVDLSALGSSQVYQTWMQSAPLP